MPTKILPGQPYPQGATWDGSGVNFAVYSECATKIELCLFDELDSNKCDVIEIRECTAYVWHCYIPTLTIGQLYGFRVHGPFDPQKGHRFNPAKLLIDPYTKAIAGAVDWHYPVFAYKQGDDQEDLSLDDRDDAAGVPKSVVVAEQFDWQGDRPPYTRLHDSIIYEVHVKGFTARNPNIPEAQRGTYAGLAAPASIAYLKKLGVTAVELMPVHDFLDDNHLGEKGLHNYWGYNTTNFFSPTALYSSTGSRGQQVNEFKAMVRELHRANIEVILDVVYNHTSEGNQMGPTLSFRGICNTTYYRLMEDNPRYYMDYTGTGNTLNVRNPQVLKMVMDSLRYWVLEMHVDGFRFDLASALARELQDVDKLSSFFDVINQDPVISQVKLIAEPWDIGDGGYQVGRFPILWAEWNGKYRDAIRKFWKGDDGQLAEFGYRFTGSSDLYQRDGRRPSASINFITAHDGFTLNDLVSYDTKHNDANGENGQDGSNDNHSCNYGAEGPTDDRNIRELRERQKRNFLATLLLSQGVPMLCGGDEISRTQNGNNNAYAQDNELTWFDWNLDHGKKALLDFTCQLIHLRKSHPNLHRRKFFQDRKISPSTAEPQKVDGLEVLDIGWYRPDGQQMTEEEWNAGWVRCLGVRLSGRTLNDFDQNGNPIRDDSFLFCVNPHREHIKFYLPPCTTKCAWQIVMDTREACLKEVPMVQTGESYDMTDYSCVLFMEMEQPEQASQQPGSTNEVDLQHVTAGE